MAVGRKPLTFIKQKFISRRGKNFVEAVRLSGFKGCREGNTKICSGGRMELSDWIPAGFNGWLKKVSSSRLSYCRHF